MKFCITGVILLGMASAASAQTVPGLGDLIGARGSSVESEMESRGYAYAGTLGSAVLWWNAQTGTCASVAVDQGRVQSIQSASPGDCGVSAPAHHSSHSGHAAHANISDLVGTDAIHAIDVLTEWGFRNVDSITAGDEIYGTFWKASSHECVQLNSRNGTVFGVDRVDSHPGCR